MDILRLLLLFETITFAWAFDCGTLHVTPTIVREYDRVELVYTYNPGKRYEPRLWYRLRGQLWTKIYDSTNGLTKEQIYKERFHDNRYILTLPSATFTDAGNYVVKCSTIQNTMSQTVQLKVLPQSIKQGLCGRLDILSNGSPLGSYVHFVFKTNTPQRDVTWQIEVNGQYLNLGRDFRVELTKNAAHTVFVRKVYSTKSDVGTYRVICEDGTVSNIVELSVDIVPPSQPVIYNVTSYQGCNNCLLAIPGQSLTITCSSYNGSAPVDLKLYIDNVKIDQAVSSDVTYSRISVEKYHLVSHSDENAVVKCSAQNVATEQPVVTEARIYLFRKPDPPLITSYSGTEGKTANITCVSVGGKPAPSIRFKYNNNVIRPDTKTTLNDTSGTLRVDSFIQMNLTREDNLRLIECRSDLLNSRKTSTKLLSVKFPPKMLSVSKVKQTSNIVGDTNLTLQCIVGESNPKSTVIWQGLDTMVRSESDGKDKLNAGENGGWTFQHEMKFLLTKEDNNRKIKCAALNSEFPNLVLEKSYRVRIPYQPIVSIPMGSNVTVFEGSDVKITCVVDSNPKSKLRWSREDILLDSTDGGGSESSPSASLDLILYNISTQEDSTVYACTAKNGIGGDVVRNVTLFVKDKSLAYHRVSRRDDDGSMIAGIICGLLLLFAIVILLVFAIRRHRMAAKEDNNSTVQIRFEDRQPSIQPQVEEPVYNNVNRAIKPNVNEEPAVYAQVIPKSQRQTITVMNEDYSNAEYATVIPKSQRLSGDNNLDTNQVPQGKNNLVYAELDLQPSNTENIQHSQDGANSQRTEYVSIDFTKTKTLIENKHVE